MYGEEDAGTSDVPRVYFAGLVVVGCRPVCA